MLKRWSGMVKWSGISLQVHLSHHTLRYMAACSHTCHLNGQMVCIIAALRQHHTFVPNAQAVAWLGWSNGQYRHCDCMHPCHITHSSPMLKWWPGKAALRHLHDISLQAPLSHHPLVPNACHIAHWALFAISMINDCMHPWLSHQFHQKWSLSSLLFAISMIHDLVISHIHPQCSSSGLEWSNGQYRHCSSPSAWLIYDCRHPCDILHWSHMGPQC